MLHTVYGDDRMYIVQMPVPPAELFVSMPHGAQRIQGTPPAGEPMRYVPAPVHAGYGAPVVIPPETLMVHGGQASMPVQYASAQRMIVTPQPRVLLPASQGRVVKRRTPGLRKKERCKKLQVLVSQIGADINRKCAMREVGASPSQSNSQA